ncbi:transketolase [Alphaproteobacteria bacterium]|nr:transketolase [Alphaproteobacteria bacterium]
MNKLVAMRDALLKNILEAMREDENVYFVTADFGSPILDHIRADFPNRFVNVGVAEQNLINISSGLALEGYTVFSYGIAPFITMRCFEQLRVNLALLSEVRDINVNLIGVGAGYSYVVSGPTHQCYEDISLIRSLPNFKLYSSSDQHIAGSFIDYCRQHKGPKYLRFDAQILPELRQGINRNAMDDGFEILRPGTDGVLIATGYMTHTALAVAGHLSRQRDLMVIDLFNLTGYNQSKLLLVIDGQPAVFSLEEGFANRGGVDALIGELIKSSGTDTIFEGIGVRPGYSFDLGTRQELHEVVGIGQNAVTKRVEQTLISIS